MDIWLTDIYRAERMSSQATNIYGPYVVVSSNELSVQLQQNIVFGASLGSLNCKFRIGVACTSGKHAVQMELDDIIRRLAREPNFTAGVTEPCKCD